MAMALKAKRKAGIKGETGGKARPKGKKPRGGRPHGAKAAVSKKDEAPLRAKELRKKGVAELRALAEKMGIALRAAGKAGIIDEMVRKAPKAHEEKRTYKEKKMKPPTSKPPGYGEAPAAPRKKVAPEGKALPSAGKALPPVIEEEPEEKRLYGPAMVRALPERDITTAIAVEPGKLFAFWELTGKTARKGEPALRVHDVTRGGGEDSFFEIRLPGRSGGIYIGVLPGRQYVVQAGVLGPGGRFLSARRSRRVSTPPAMPSGEEALLPEVYFRFRPVRYGG